MKHNPFTVVSMLEEEIAEYAGSKYAVHNKNYFAKSTNQSRL